MARIRLFSITIISLFFFSQKLNAALCLSTGNGLWTNPATWSCGHVPTCGDSMIILAAHTVTMDTQQDYTGCAAGQGPIVVIYGTMKCDNGNKLKLPCDSRIYIMPGGEVMAGNGSGSSNYIEICGEDLWNAGMGDLPGPACLPASSPWCVGTVLPVEITKFIGEAKDGYIDLSWITASEKNNSHFEVERSSDASSFSKFATVNSISINGNSNSQLNYSAVDDSPLNNIAYYRLKQVDKDNTFNYSSIISVNYIKGKNIKFIVYPNPNKGEFTADISGIENNHEVTINLKDEKGNLVYTSNFFIQDQNSSKLQIVPESKLTSGVYICTLIIEEIQYNVKVVVS